MTAAIHGQTGLKRLETDLPLLRPGGLTLTERAVGYCKFRDSSRIADIGCGAGATVEYLRRIHSFEAVGVDIDGGRIKEGLDRNPDLPLLQADAASLPLTGGSVDVIVSECSLSVMHDKEKVLIEFQRVLKPGGRLIVSDVVAEYPAAIGRALYPRLPFCLSGLMTQEGLMGCLERHGFRIDIHEDHSHLLKSFIGRLIMESDSGCRDFGPDLEALKQAKPHYLLLTAIKGEES